jgi:hypothetical protein
MMAAKTRGAGTLGFEKRHDLRGGDDRVAVFPTDNLVLQCYSIEAGK